MLDIINKRFKDKGCTLKEFAEYVGMDYSNLSKFLKGETSIRSKKLEKVCEFLDLVLIDKEEETSVVIEEQLIEWHKKQIEGIKRNKNKANETTKIVKTSGKGKKKTASIG